MIALKIEKILLIIMLVHIISCTRPLNKTTTFNVAENQANTQQIAVIQNTVFPQIHSNLNGMVREFVRVFHQDKKGHYWFGTNGDGIIRYDGRSLEKMIIPVGRPYCRVLEIAEDKASNIWFATSEGLLKYDGVGFKLFAANEGLPGADPEIWGLAIDSDGLIWVGAMEGVYQFNGEKFIPFSLPASKIDHLKPMLSDKLVFKIIEDKNGSMWFVADGKGIFKYSDGAFIQFTINDGLTDNSVADILEDKKGNIWIGTFNGGVSKYDGTTFTNFTKDGLIQGDEAYNFYEDSQGNIWFTAEGYGVYRYDGINFKQFTTEDGLTSNVTLSILEDNKGQMWFGSWQGLSIYDGKVFTNANTQEPWTK